GFCDRTDVIQAKKFSRENRELLPEIIVIHLESEGLDVGSMGKNWKGRMTKQFGNQDEKIVEIVKGSWWGRWLKKCSVRYRSCNK
ncbi:MAG: hypothetical protein MUP85_01365, partial [Candidatus Lokiarchaeota archaeon]|nr:hypothetical protein [Candidatus Lokiarchaeota archaeon]